MNSFFLKNIITDDKKWVFYNTAQCKRQLIEKDASSEPTIKAELHGRKVIIVHFEFLNQNQTLDANLYSQ